MRRVLVIAGALACAAFASHASDYTRDGGTADFMCCADKACTTIISQHADSVRARDACGKLTDADGVTRYTRSNAFRITKPGAPPPPTCPPKPADETRTAQCTAPQVGSWQQVLAYVSAPAPTCWTAGPWTPATPPAGACTTPPPPAATSLVYSATAGSGYADLVGATVSGSINVRLSDCSAGPWAFSVDGAARNTETACPFALIDDNAMLDTATLANGAHTVKAVGSSTVSATFTVTNAAPPLGAPSVTATQAPNAVDPTRVDVKLTWSAIAGATGYEIERCSGVNCTAFTALASATAATYTNSNVPGGLTLKYRVRAVDASRQGPYSSIVSVVTATPPPVGTGSTTLGWTPPTQNTDGSTLTDLVGYQIDYGTAPTSLTSQIIVQNAALTSYIVSNLGPGTWYFAVKSLAGNAACLPPSTSCVVRPSAPSNVVSKVVQ